MQYSEVNTLLDDKDFIKVCLITGKSPKEVAKDVFDMRRDCDVWNRSHIEYGELTNVKRSDYDSGSYIVEVFYNGRTNRRGNSSYNCKTSFIDDEGQLYDEYKSMIGCSCKFYVGYVENREDGSVFRSLLGVEKA